MMLSQSLSPQQHKIIKGWETAASAVSPWYLAYIWVYSWLLFGFYFFIRPTTDYQRYFHQYHQKNPMPTPHNQPPHLLAQAYLRWCHKTWMVVQIYHAARLSWAQWDNVLDTTPLASLYQHIQQQEAPRIASAGQALTKHLPKQLLGLLPNSWQHCPLITQAAESTATRLHDTATAEQNAALKKLDSQQQAFQQNASKKSQLVVRQAYPMTLVTRHLPKKIADWLAEVEAFRQQCHNAPFPEPTYDTMDDILRAHWPNRIRLHKAGTRLLALYHPDKCKHTGVSPSLANHCTQLIMQYRPSVIRANNYYIRRVQNAVIQKPHLFDGKKITLMKWLSTLTTPETQEIYDRLAAEKRAYEETKQKLEESIREREQSERELEESIRDLEESIRKREQSEREREQSERELEKAKREREKARQIRAAAEDELVYGLMAFVERYFNIQDQIESAKKDNNLQALAKLEADLQEGDNIIENSDEDLKGVAKQLLEKGPPLTLSPEALRLLLFPPRQTTPHPTNTQHNTTPQHSY